MNERLSLIFFVLLFPGVFFYSSAVATQIIPAVLGGGFGVFATAALATLLPSLLVTAVSLRGAGLIVTTLFFTLVAYSAAWLLAHHSMSDAAQSSQDVFSQWVTVIGSWIALFSIGYFWPSILSRRHVAILLACAAGMAVTVLLNLDFGRLLFVVGVSDIDGVISYQGLARSAAMTGLVLLAVIRNMFVSALLVIVMLVTLFFIGARSEMVGVIATLPLIAYLHFRQSPSATLVAGFASTFVVAVLLVSYWPQLSTSRQLEIMNLSESSSWTQRAVLRDEAFKAIEQSPVLGDFAGHARNRDTVGSYAHSVVSVWRQLGVAGFGLYLSLMFISLVISVKKFRNTQDEVADLPRIAGTLSLFSLVLILGAKPIFWAFPALAWGLSVACYRHNLVTILAPESSEKTRRSRSMRNCSLDFRDYAAN